VVEQSTYNPKFKGLNPAVIGIEVGKTERNTLATAGDRNMEVFNVT
jgi:hypothetical protein